MRPSTIAIVAASVVAPAFVSAYPTLVARTSTTENDRRSAKQYLKLAGDGLGFIADGANAVSAIENDVQNSRRAATVSEELKWDVNLPESFTSEYDRRSGAKKYLKLAGDGLDFIADGANAAGAIKNDVENSRRSKTNWVKDIDSGLKLGSQAANAVQAVAGAVGRRTQYWQEAANGLDLFTDGANAASTTENDRRSAKEYLKLAGDGLDFIADGANAAGAIKNDVENSRRSKTNWVKDIDSGLQLADHAVNAVQAVAGAVGRREFMEELLARAILNNLD